MAAELWLKEIIDAVGVFLGGFFDFFWSLVASWFGL